MKKRILSVIAAICISFIISIPAFAGVHLCPRVVDNADLLDDYEESELLSKLDEISERQQCDVAVVTVNSLDGKTAEEYADDFYDYNGYGMGENDDGILLLVSMADRDWHITTTGDAINKISDYDIDYLSELFLSDLSDGNYLRSFSIFADGCDELLEYVSDYGYNGYDDYDYDKNYDDYGSEDKSLGFFPRILMSLGIGGVSGLIGSSSMKSKLKSVKSQNFASNYVKNNSFKVTQQKDIFLYKNVAKTPIQRDNTGSSSSRGGGYRGGGGGSFHTSSSGRSHGGGGGKF